jgi:hypothetical protein
MKTILNGRFLFWRAEGPQLEYRDGSLFIADLNPEIELSWRISRTELFAIGLRCLRASLALQ